MQIRKPVRRLDLEPPHVRAQRSLLGGADDQAVVGYPHGRAVDAEHLTGHGHLEGRYLVENDERYRVHGTILADPESFGRKLMNIGIPATCRSIGAAPESHCEHWSRKERKLTMKEIVVRWGSLEDEGEISRVLGL